MKLSVLFLIFFVHQILCVLEPQFQWKYIDYLWKSASARNNAIKTGDYKPENNLPFGLARWKDQLFITVPRIKKGVPSSLNYIMLNGAQEQLLRPYPNWDEGFVSDKARSPPGNRSVVCAFKVYVDSCDRLWTVDNGVSDITGEANQISDPAIMVFDLKTDQLIHKHVLGSNVFRSSSIFTSIVVDIIKGKENCANSEAFAYITDMGSNALVVYSLKEQEAWRFENPYFYFDPRAGTYKVGGIEFFLSDGISSAALSNPVAKGYRDLYFHPTSSTKLFKISTKLLRNKNMTYDHVFNGVNVVGDKGDMSQATACDFDPRSNVLFYTQLSKYGIGCWNTKKPFTVENNPIILRDCFIMEFPSDVKVDHENNLWMISNRQSRFLFGNMDFDEVNFRILTAPVPKMIQGSTCDKRSFFSKCFSSFYPTKSSTPKSKDDIKAAETRKSIDSLDKNKDAANKKTFDSYDSPHNHKDGANRETFGSYDSLKNLKDGTNIKSFGAMDSPSNIKDRANRKSFGANDSPRKSFGSMDSPSNLKDGTIRKSYGAIDSPNKRKDDTNRKSTDSIGSYQKRRDSTNRKSFDTTDRPRKDDDYANNNVIIITIDNPNKYEGVMDKKAYSYMDSPSKRKDDPYKERLGSDDSFDKQKDSKKKKLSTTTDKKSKDELAQCTCDDDDNSKGAKKSHFHKNSQERLKDSKTKKLSATTDKKSKDELAQCTCDNDDNSKSADSKNAKKSFFHKNAQDEYEEADEEARSIVVILSE